MFGSPWFEICLPPMCPTESTVQTEFLAPSSYPFPPDVHLRSLLSGRPPSISRSFKIFRPKSDFKIRILYCTFSPNDLLPISALSSTFGSSIALVPFHVSLVIRRLTFLSMRRAGLRPSRARVMFVKVSPCFQLILLSAMSIASMPTDFKQELTNRMKFQKFATHLGLTL